MRTIPPSFRDLAEVAEKALRLITGPRRWRKGGALTGGRVCLGNAIMLAALYDGRNDSIVRDDPAIHPFISWGNVAWELASAARIILEQFPERIDTSLTKPGDVVMSFNDDHRTSCADVQLVLEKMRAG